MHTLIHGVLIQNGMKGCAMKKQWWWLVYAVVAIASFFTTQHLIRVATQRDQNNIEIAATRVLIVQWADALSVQRRSDGLFERYTSFAPFADISLPEYDEWGIRLHSRYVPDVYDIVFPRREKFIVYSLGPDRIRGSSDDIIESRLAIERPPPQAKIVERPDNPVTRR